MFTFPQFSQQPQNTNRSRSGMRPSHSSGMRPSHSSGMRPSHSSGMRPSHSSGKRRSAATTITNQAMQLVGRHVKINRAGPDSVEGRLLAVNGEVLVVSAQGTIVYVNAAHVKSITEGTSAGKGGASAGSGIRFSNASTMNSLLTGLRHQFVQINQGGPEKLEGFLAEISSDFVLIVVGRELVRVPIFHIKTVSVSKGKSGGNKQHQNQNQSGQSGGNRSRSGQRKSR